MSSPSAWFDASTQSPVRAEQSASALEVRRALIKKATAEDLNQFREQFKSRISIEQNFAASTAAVSASVSIGYVIWLLRGGVLLSSLLASIPAWSAIDPLPILSNAGAGKRGKDGDDESLQDMLKKAELERERVAKEHSRPEQRLHAEIQAEA